MSFDSIRHTLCAVAICTPLPAFADEAPSDADTATPARPAASAEGSDAPPSAAKEVPPLSDEAKQISEELDRTLPKNSEARAMYEDILDGRQLGPTDGWFRTAVSQTRFDWPSVKAKYDKDGNDAILADEFGGLATDFARLDRNADGKVKEADLNWQDAPSRGPDPTSMVFRMADTNVDGRITPEEFANLFAKLDSDSAGFVTFDDLREQFSIVQAAGSRSSSGMPDRDTLLRGLIRQELGSLQAGPELNEKAPDFTLATVDGNAHVALSDVIGPKPVVLVFGNFTCGPFRGQSGNVEKVYRRYKDRANFLMVYVREAHPTDGWHMESNERVGVSLPQPQNYEERVSVAARCQGHIKFEMPFLVDTIDDQVGATYSGMPSRLYVLDQAGKVAFKSGRGPFGFRPAEMQQALILLLNESAEVATGRPN